MYIGMAGTFSSMIDYSGRDYQFVLAYSPHKFLIGA